MESTAGEGASRAIRDLLGGVPISWHWGPAAPLLGSGNVAGAWGLGGGGVVAGFGEGGGTIPCVIHRVGPAIGSSADASFCWVVLCALGVSGTTVVATSTNGFGWSLGSCSGPLELALGRNCVHVWIGACGVPHGSPGFSKVCIGSASLERKANNMSRFVASEILAIGSASRGAA